MGLGQRGWRGVRGGLGFSGMLVALACGGSQSDASNQTVQGGNAYGPAPGQGPVSGNPTPYAAPQQGQPAGYGQASNPTQVTPTTPPPSALSPLCTEATAIVCGGHRCNTQVGRCSMPCGSAQDCNPGFSCLGAGGPTAICVPGGP
jgi:hypothetical protein